MIKDLLSIQEDLLVLFFAVVSIGLGIIIFVLFKSTFIHQRIERNLVKKLKNKEFNAVINLAKDFIDNEKPPGKKEAIFVMYYLAQAYEALDSFTSALKFYQEASLLSGKNKRLSVSILIRIAFLYQKMGKVKDALAHYFMVLDKDEFNPEALYNIAWLYYNNKNFKKARESLEKLLKKRAGILEARFLYGKILFETNRYQDAYSQFCWLERYDRDNYELAYMKCRALENLKRYTEAIKEYRKLIEREWKDIPSDKNKLLQEILEKSKIAIINLFIKIKDYISGIQYVSQYLSEVTSEDTKTELLYLYANLLWNTGEEYKALKNFERIYMMEPDFKDVAIMYERYKKILPHSYVSQYFTSNEDSEQLQNFDSFCRKILGRHNFNLLYKHNDFYIYSKGVFYVIFYRHIEPIPFSKLTDMEIILNSFDIKPQNIEIYSISGVREDAITHFLLKSSRLIEGTEFINTVKKVSQKGIHYS